MRRCRVALDQLDIALIETVRLRLGHDLDLGSLAVDRLLEAEHGRTENGPTRAGAGPRQWMRSTCLGVRRGVDQPLPPLLLGPGIWILGRFIEHRGHAIRLRRINGVGAHHFSMMSSANRLMPSSLAFRSAFAPA